MAKIRTPMVSKGKWLELDSHSKSNESILSIVRTIQNADIKVVDGKTYIRLPISKAKREPLFPRIIKTDIYNKGQALKIKEFSESRQYCAVILKDEK